MRRLFDPVVWISAVFLLALWYGFGLVASAVIPRLIELLDRSPRLAMLGFLALVLSPGLFAAFVHRVTHGTMDRIEGVSARASSAWAGAFVWLVLFGTDIVTVFVMLVIHPPEPDPDALASAALSTVLAQGSLFGLRTVVWLSVAATFFALERAGRKR